MQEMSTNPNGAEGSLGESMPPFMIKSPSISFLCSGPPHHVEYFQGPREIPENTAILHLDTYRIILVYA